MAANQVYDQLKALEINNTANYSVNASRSEVGNTLTGTTKTYSTLDAQGVESVNSVAEWSKANDNANQYFESVVSGEATGNFATQKGRVQNYIGNGFGLDSPAVDSKLFKAFDVDESVSSGYDKTYNFSTGSGETTSASDLVFDKTLISSERTSVSQNIKIPTFDATTQSNMGADLAAYNDKTQSSRTAFNADEKVVNFSLDAGGTTDIVPSLINDFGVLPEIQPIAIPAIPAEDGYLQTADLGETKVPGFFHQDSSDPFFTNETFIPSAFDGTEATAIEAYKLEAAADAGRNFLKESFTYVPQPEITSFDELKAPHFGVTNPMISTPGTPNGLAAAIDADDALNDKLQAEYLVSKQVDKMLDEAEDKAAETQKKLTFEAERAAEAALAAEVAANNKRIRFEEAKKEAKRNADDLMDQMAEDTAKKIEAERLQALQLANDKYVGDSQYLGQDPIQVELIKEAKLERERLLALQENAHLVADEKLIATAKKVKEEKAAASAIQREKDVKQREDVINSAIQREKDVKQRTSALQREKDLKQRESALQREKDVKQRESALQREKDVKERTRLLKEEKAQKESDIRSDNHFNRNQVPINPSMAQDKTALQRTLAQNERNEFLADLNANAERNGRLGDTADDIAPPSTFGNNSRRKGRYSSFMTGRDEDG